MVERGRQRALLRNLVGIEAVRDNFLQKLGK
jgi:hypothetical protein